jgi:hypothetical protein
MATIIILALCAVPLVLLVGDLARNRRRRDDRHRSYGAQLKS